MLTNNKGEPVFCRCDCGQVTAYVKTPPGSKLKSPYFGYVTGHKINKSAILDVTTQRKAELLIGAAEILGLIDKRFDITRAMKQRIER